MRKGRRKSSAERCCVPLRIQFLQTSASRKMVCAEQEMTTVQPAYNMTKETAELGRHHRKGQRQAQPKGQPKGQHNQRHGATKGTTKGTAQPKAQHNQRHSTTKGTTQPKAQHNYPKRDTATAPKGPRNSTCKGVTKATTIVGKTARQT